MVVKRQSISAFRFPRHDTGLSQLRDNLRAFRRDRIPAQLDCLDGDGRGAGHRVVDNIIGVSRKLNAEPCYGRGHDCRMWLKACGCNRLAIATFLNPTRSGGDEGGWNGFATVYEAVFDELESARPLALPRFLSTNTEETAFGI